MQFAVFEERKQAEVEAYQKAAAALVPLRDSYTPLSPERAALAKAEAMLREASVMIAHLGERLFTYSQPEFYADMPPSSAKQDGGKYAADGLEYAFGE